MGYYLGMIGKCKLSSFLLDGCYSIACVLLLTDLIDGSLDLWDLLDLVSNLELTGLVGMMICDGSGLDSGRGMCCSSVCVLVSVVVTVDG